MLNKFIGMILGIAAPVVVFVIRSVSAYYVIDIYLREQKYSRISRVILTPLLGTGSLFFTCIRSIFCIPGDLYNSVRIGYQEGIVGVLAIPLHFTTKVSHQVWMNRGVTGMIPAFFGRFLCRISILQTTINDKLLSKVEENSKQAITDQRNQAVRKSELDNAERARKKQAFEEKIAAEKQQLEKEKREEEEKKKQTDTHCKEGREQLITQVVAGDQATAGLKKTRKQEALRKKNSC